jgi:hypothetical protein
MIKVNLSLLVKVESFYIIKLLQQRIWMTTFYHICICKVSEPGQ